VQLDRRRAIAADIEDVVLTVRQGQPVTVEQVTALSQAAEDLADNEVDQTVELELPDGWTLLQVGFSTPYLPLKDGVSGGWYFAVAPGTDDGVAAFHAVIDAWRADPATKAAAKQAGYVFNYGDAIDHIDPATWRAGGLIRVRLVANEHLDLDHDELLVGLPTDDDR
jgi:hypothetical protein